MAARMFGTSRWIRRLLVCAVGAGVFGLSLDMVRSEAPPLAPAAPATVLTLPLRDQIITPTVAEYLAQGIRRAEERGMSAVLIELDTPGGLLDSTQTIVKHLLNAKVPVIVYVSPAGARAASAGMFITIAAHVAAMAPSTHIGAAHPVNYDGGDIGTPAEPDVDDADDAGGAAKSKRNKKSKDAAKPKGGAMEDKIMNDTLAWARSIAAQRGRNADWAVEAVRDSRSSTAEEAQALGVIDVVADSVPALLRAIDGRTVRLGEREVMLALQDAAIEVFPLNWRQRLLQVLANPNVAYILMMLGFYGLLFEITHPGGWIPGIAGAICLILAFYALNTLPTNYAGVALIILGIVLFLLEVKVVSYGFLSLAGVACLFFGSVMLIDSDFGFMRLSLQVVIPVVAAAAGVSLFLVVLAARTHHAPVQVGNEGMIGQIGEVSVALDPRGKIYIAGEIWDAEATEAIPHGAEVEVTAVEPGMRLRVRRKSAVST